MHKVSIKVPDGRTDSCLVTIEKIDRIHAIFQSTLKLKISYLTASLPTLKSMSS